MRADVMRATPNIGAALALTHAVLGIRSAAAKSVQPRDFGINSRTFLDSCPPRYRIDFQSDATWFHVDPHWLDTASLDQLADRFRNQCPTAPVRTGQGLINSFSFNYSAISAAQITPTTLGSSYFGLHNAFIRWREDKPFLELHREPVHQSYSPEQQSAPSAMEEPELTFAFNMRIPTSMDSILEASKWAA